MPTLPKVLVFGESNAPSKLEELTLDARQPRKILLPKNNNTSGISK